MKVSQLIRELPCLVELKGDSETEVKSLCADSRNIAPGALFFCIRGLKTDAHDFAPQAAEKGAVALVVERLLPLDVCQILVSDVRAAMSYIAQAFYDYPARSLKLIGVTGTKGKSTTCFLIKSILEAAGYKAGLMGTITTMIGDKCLPSDLTTPDPLDFQKLLRQMADENVQVVVMEVSAHALALHKLVGMKYEEVAFTNLSQDHLDFFGTMDNYLAAKEELLTSKYTKHAYINGDDEHAAHVIKSSDIKVDRYAIREKADIYANNIDIAVDGVSFALHFHNRYMMNIKLKLSGLFNVYNSLTAAAICDGMGIDPQFIKQGLETIANVPGRMEPLDTDTPYTVILDYAHTPDALENILNAVHELPHKRIIVVFGCGGDRDKGKRPMMGEIGSRLADVTILTSDNPRSEEPMKILAMIEEGARKTGKPYSVIENRREAIRYALSIGLEGDIIVLAGKGHETYQEISGVKNPFDEKVVVRELLEGKRS